MSRKVAAMCEDKQGYLWIGSQVGLQRFDGKHFKNYLADVRDTAALQTDRISALFEDSRGRLWVGTDHGSLAHFCCPATAAATASAGSWNAA